MMMQLKEAITGRRSVRAYEERPVPGELIRELIGMGICAPTASRMQPWAFAVVENREKMREWSDKAKELLLGRMADNPYLRQYKAAMENKEFNIFYNAPCLLLIYGDTASPNHVVDCALAAQNIMLAAYEKGVGSCWVGFATQVCNTPEIKDALGVPGDYRPVAPLILGYPRGQWPPVPRREPVVFSWIK
ncbi:MAG: nitroreductase family protein [Firmicutes bacterium]|nr:nitroreductase family protein [Bacillota bacterium]